MHNDKTGLVVAACIPYNEGIFQIYNGQTVRSG